MTSSLSASALSSRPGALLITNQVDFSTTHFTIQVTNGERVSRRSTCTTVQATHNKELEACFLIAPHRFTGEFTDQLRQGDPSSDATGESLRGHTDLISHSEWPNAVQA